MREAGSTLGAKLFWGGRVHVAGQVASGRPGSRQEPSRLGAAGLMLGAGLMLREAGVT